MANRRMFSLDVVDTDLFLEMPASTQALYFHLGMRADDDGFVSSPKKITSMVNCGTDDLNVLIAKGLVIAFEEGIVVITDWKVNNYIQKDRYKSTKYIKQKEELSIEGDGSYRRIQPFSKLDTDCIQHVPNLEAQVRLGKYSIVKDKKEKIYIHIPNVEKVELTQEQYDKLVAEHGKEYVDNKILDMDSYVINNPKKAYKDYYRALGTWIRKDKQQNKKEEEYDPLYFK